MQTDEFGSDRLIVEQIARVATERQLHRAQVAATDGATTAGHRGLGALERDNDPMPGRAWSTPLVYRSRQ
jgi:hypothetical protein